MTEGEILPRSPSALPSIHKRNFNESTSTIPKINEDSESVVNQILDQNVAHGTKILRRKNKSQHH